MILQKHARAWLARRRFQSIRRLVLNVQLAHRVQRLQKKLEDQVGSPGVSCTSHLLTGLLRSGPDPQLCFADSCLGWELQTPYTGRLS